MIRISRMPLFVTKPVESSRWRRLRLVAMAGLVVALGGCATYGDYGYGGGYYGRPSVGYYGSYGRGHGYDYGYGGYGGYSRYGHPYGYGGSRYYYGDPYGYYSGYYGYPYRYRHPRPPVHPTYPPIDRPALEGRNDQPAWRDRDGRYVRSGSHPMRPPRIGTPPPSPSQPSPIAGVDGPGEMRPPRMERPIRIDRPERGEGMRMERPERAERLRIDRPARERIGRERDAGPELTP